MMAEGGKLSWYGWYVHIDGTWVSHSFLGMNSLIGSMILQPQRLGPRVVSPGDEHAEGRSMRPAGGLLGSWWKMRALKW